MSLVIAGFEFPLREEPPKGGRFAVLFRRQRDAKHDGARAACLLDMAEAIVSSTIATDGVTTLEDAACEVELTELDHAIGDALAEFANHPTKRSADSSDGPPNTAPTSRVVSFSRGTVETVPESSTG